MKKALQHRLQLPPEERLILQQQLIRFSERAGHSITLNKLINAWRYCVAEIERGYAWGAYEYDNDLASRDLLQSVLELALPSLTTQLMDLLASWDARFWAATYQQLIPIDGTPEMPHWWWYRTPKLEIEE